MTHRKLTRRAINASLLAAPAAGLAAFASSLLLVQRADAAVFDIADTDWEGLSEFFQIAKHELGPERVKPIATLDWSALKPEDGLLFMHPTEAIDPTEASEFMKLGGRIAVMDDFGNGDELLRRFKIQRIRMPGRPVTALRQNPELPIAEPWLEMSKGSIGPPHPVVSNVKRLVLNHPMALVHPDLSPVLKVRLAGSEGDAIVAVAGQVEKGRLFAMSDPSALINSMLRYPGNRAFAAGLVRYLANDAERGQGRLFIVANAYKQEGSINGNRSMFQEAENALRSLADSLADIRKNGFPSWLLAICAALGIAGLGVWVGRAAGRPYRSPLPRYARATPLVARGGVAGRFAMLAAPSSPRGLVLLELKSALFEAIGERFTLDPSPSADAVIKAVHRSGLVEAPMLGRLQQVIGRMQRVEASVVAGAGAKVRREVVDEAHAVVKAVVEACGALDAKRPAAKTYTAPDYAPAPVDGADGAPPPAIDGSGGAGLPS